MRTNIEIDDELMRQALAASSAVTKRAVVEEALRLLLQIKGQAVFRELRGKVVWRGHDDDWLASDEEILEKHHLAETLSKSGKEGELTLTSTQASR